MSTSSGWLLQHVRIRIAMMGIRRTLHLHLRLWRHGKLSWQLPMPTLRCFCNSCKSATKGKATKESKSKATISLSLLPSTSSSQTSRSSSVTMLRPQTPTTGSWISANISSVAMSGLRTLSSLLCFNSRTKLLIGINNIEIPEEVV